MTDTLFHCTQCGLCCRHIDRVPQLAEFDLGNGTCRHLKGNLCDIYDHRPEICQVDHMYEVYFKDKYTKEEFYKLNEEVCHLLQQK